MYENLLSLPIVPYSTGLGFSVDCLVDRKLLGGTRGMLPTNAHTVCVGIRRAIALIGNEEKRGPVETRLTKLAATALNYSP